MTRDYKSAKRPKDRRKKSRRKTDEPATPGWVWMLAGLLLGLLLAGTVYYRELAPSGPRVGKQAEPQAQAAEPEAAQTEAAEPEPGKTSFDFYEMLPKFEVVIPEKELDVRRDSDRTPVRDEGSYILQVGAFQNHVDADRVKAKLALLGVESRIQKVSIDQQTWHRVRVGPINELDELNATRARLLDAGVEMLIIRSDR